METPCPLCNRSIYSPTPFPLVPLRCWWPCLLCRHRQETLCPPSVVPKTPGQSHPISLLSQRPCSSSAAVIGKLTARRRHRSPDPGAKANGSVAGLGCRERAPPPSSSKEQETFLGTDGMEIVESGKGGVDADNGTGKEGQYGALEVEGGGWTPEAGCSRRRPEGSCQHRWLRACKDGGSGSVVEVNSEQMTVLKAQAGLKNNVRRLNKRIIEQGSNHVVHVVLFALFCFFLVYLWSKFSRR